MAARVVSHAAPRGAMIVGGPARRTPAALRLLASTSLIGTPSHTAPAAAAADRISSHQARHATGKAAAPNGSYAAQKAAAKEKRREAYRQKMSRRERLITRREGRPTDVRKDEFRAWFDKVAVSQQIMDRRARQAGLPWRVRVVSVVERIPVVTPDKPEWERDYIDLKSYLLAFGKEYPKELGFMREADETDRPDLTEEDLLAMLPEGFTPAPRETEADRTGEVKTLDRKLKTRVYLIVQQKKAEEGSGESAPWTFPSAVAEEDETLLDAAKRATADAVGKKLELYCPSNCPMAVNMRAFGDEERKDKAKAGYYGEKTFYFRVQLDDGDVSEKSMAVADYAWLDSEEVVERVKEKSEHYSKFFHYLL